MIKGRVRKNEHGDWEYAVWDNWGSVYYDAEVILIGTRATQLEAYCEAAGQVAVYRAHCWIRDERRARREIP